MARADADDRRFETPKGIRRSAPFRGMEDRDRLGRSTEWIARNMGTPWFLLGLTVFCVAWLMWNTYAPVDARFDSQIYGFTVLTLILSLQASYAAPLILLAQNRQDDRDRVQIEQDRQRAERNLADTEYLAREVVALRLAVKELASKEFIRSELRQVLEELDRRDEEDPTVPPLPPADGSGNDEPDGIVDGAAAVERAVQVALGGVIDPEIRKPITELDMVAGVEADGAGRVRVDVRLTIVGCPASARIERDVRDAAEQVVGAGNADVVLSVMTPEQRAALTERLRGGRARTNPFGPGTLTRVIAVTSGKGGVGKSTLTANLAVALAARGLAVGLVDADVHGFSIPGLLGLVDADGLAARPTRVDDMILPPVAHGVKVVSIGMFVEPSEPGGRASSVAVAWRGPMLHRTLQQFLTDVYFGDLDVLLVDLPPGTGDIAISLGQLLPNAEVVVVTTPQPAAADVAERSGVVARQTGQRVVGVVENMAAFTSADGSLLDLFGAGGGEEVARRLSEGQDEPVPLLASVPLSVALRRGGDEGVPVVVAEPDDPAARAIEQVAAAIAGRPRSLQGRRLDVSVR